MAEKIATREAFGKAIAALSAEYPELVVLDADLAGATKSGEFKKACPEHFLDMGIAEADMVGVAAGLATCGKSPSAAPSPCSPPGVPMSRCETPWLIPT